MCKGWLDRGGCRVADVVVQERATALSDIDEQWLTAALEQAGATNGARVVAMSASTSLPVVT